MLLCQLNIDSFLFLPLFIHAQTGLESFNLFILKKSVYIQTQLSKD